MFIKNMRWFLRDADSSNPYIHIQMLAKEGVGGGNREYGDAFDIPLSKVFEPESLDVAEVQAAVRNDTVSLATDKPYTKGKIIVREDSYGNCPIMRISLAREGKMVRFFLDGEFDAEIQDHTKFAMRNGLEITEQ